MRLFKVFLLTLCLILFAACGGGGGGDGGGEVTPPVIDPPVVDTTAPVVSITAPLSNAKATGFTTITVSASDNVGVTRVDFFVNGVQIGSDLTAPYFFNWSAFSIPAGSYTLSARAYDSANNFQSSNVVVTVPAITASMATVPTGTTAVGIVTVAGLAALPDAYGLEFVVTMPPGTSISLVTRTGPYAGATGGTTPGLNPNTIIYASSNVASGEVMTINFAGVPVGTTAANFGISLSAVFDGAGVQIQ